MQVLTEAFPSYGEHSTEHHKTRNCPMCHRRGAGQWEDVPTRRHHRPGNNRWPLWAGTFTLRIKIQQMKMERKKKNFQTQAMPCKKTLRQDHGLFGRVRENPLYCRGPHRLIRQYRELATQGLVTMCRNLNLNQQVFGSCWWNSSSKKSIWVPPRCYIEER